MDAAFSPRVVGRSRPDFHSLEALLASPQFAGKEGEALVMAIYNHFTSQIDGTYHFWPSAENDGQPRKRRPCADPIKIFNAYGWAICGQMAHMLFAIYTAAGLKTRLYGLPGHALCEVFYDGRWHHFDVDMWSWYRTPQGHVASAWELCNNAHALIVDNKNKSNPCNLPDRSLVDYATMYSKAEKGDGELKSLRPDWGIRAHNMDFQLRPGETVIRTEENQGRFVMPQNWVDYQGKFEREWHGHPRERFAPFRSFGNGRWIYEPNLSNQYRDFEAGVWEQQGVRQLDAGLTGAGTATFRMQSPYPFAGIPDWKTGKVTSSSGIWLEIAGQGDIRVEITDPEGQWSTVYACDQALDERIDITSLMKARYECFIRFTLGPNAQLKRFRFEGFIMTCPISLPRLEQGENPMELRSGDKHGMHTVPWNQIVDFRETADLLGQCVKVENAALKPYAKGWNTIAPADESKPVRATFCFDAPQGRKFGWAYALTCHREGPENQPLRKAFTEWSVDGQDWMPLSERQMGCSDVQWDCSLESEMLAPAGAPAIWLRVTSETPICNVEFYGHLLADANVDSRLEITHSWKESGVLREFKAPAGQPEYTIACGEKPYAHAIQMTVPSARK